MVPGAQRRTPDPGTGCARRDGARHDLWGARDQSRVQADRAGKADPVGLAASRAHGKGHVHPPRADGGHRNQDLCAQPLSRSPPQLADLRTPEDRTLRRVDIEALSELVPAPERGRVFERSMRPGLADCAPSGRIRLDGIARWLQDVAYADVEDAGLAQSAVWVVRRTRICVSRFPRFAEHFAVRTFCSGLGRMWAERRTTIASPDDRGAAVEAVSLWVHLDPASWRPMPFSDEEVAAYGDAAGGRRVSARLRHPPPAADAPRTAAGSSARPTATSPGTSTTPPTGSRSRRRSCRTPMSRRSSMWRSNSAPRHSRARSRSCVTAPGAGSSTPPPARRMRR